MLVIEETLSNRDLAELCGVAWETVRWWRKTGRGPEGFRLQGRVRYEAAEVQRWLEAQKTVASRTAS